MSFALIVALAIFVLIFVLRMPISIGMLVAGAFCVFGIKTKK